MGTRDLSPATPGAGDHGLMFEGCASWRGLFASDLLQIARYRCLAERDAGLAERTCAATTLSLTFGGASIVRWGRRTAQVDPVVAILQQPDVPYTTRHPWGARCHGVSILLEPSLAEALLGGAASGARGRREPATWIAPPGALWRARRLVAALEGGAPPEPLAVEGEAIELARLLTAPLVARGPRARLHPAAATRHDRVVLRTCAAIREGYRERLRLADLARQAGVSPDHLVRLFRQRVGLPAHQYQVRLRLAAALDELHDGVAAPMRPGLSGLAHDLGFSSHSHFTAAFRRAFGGTPSAVQSNRPRHSPPGGAGAAAAWRSFTAASTAGRR